METSGKKKKNLPATISLEDLEEHFYTFFATCYLNIDKGGENGAISAKFNAAAFFYEFKSPGKRRKDDKQEPCTKMMA